MLPIALYNRSARTLKHVSYIWILLRRFHLKCMKSSSALIVQMRVIYRKISLQQPQSVVPAYGTIFQDEKSISYWCEATFPLFSGVILLRYSYHLFLLNNRSQEDKFCIPSYLVSTLYAPSITTIFVSTLSTIKPQFYICMCREEERDIEQRGREDRLYHRDNYSLICDKERKYNFHKWINQ